MAPGAHSEAGQNVGGSPTSPGAGCFFPPQHRHCITPRFHEPLLSKGRSSKGKLEEEEKKVLERLESEIKRATVAKPRSLHRLAGKQGLLVARASRVPIPVGKQTPSKDQEHVVTSVRLML